MTPNKALEILEQATAGISTNRGSHGAILDALETLKAAVPASALESEITIKPLVRAYSAPNAAKSPNDEN